ncbi:MAG: hypothetical protein EOM63_04125 [Clostridia bacterium]|nr:hypothetical protein [Clostridia bacterium]
MTILKAGTTTLTATKASDAAYTQASKSCTLTVNKATLTATVDDYIKNYGDNNPAFTVHVTGFVNSDTESTADGYVVPTAICAANTTTDVGPADIIVSGGSATNYVFNTTDTGILTINPIALTLTASANNKGYDGNTDTTGTVSLTGIINSDDVTATGSFNFEDAAAGTGKNVNVTGLVLSGTDKDNYTLSTTSATTTANINPKTVSVASMTIAEREYDGTTTATINSASLNSVIGGDDVSVDYSGATATFDNANVGSDKTVNVTGLTLAGTAKDNYSLSSSS